MLMFSSCTVAVVVVVTAVVITLAIVVVVAVEVVVAMLRAQINPHQIAF